MTVTADGKWVVCDSLLVCEAKIRNHYWGRVKNGVAWFFTRDNKYAFCPEHLPHFVKDKATGKEYVR